LGLKLLRDAAGMNHETTHLRDRRTSWRDVGQRILLLLWLLTSQR
jgi:hypothetical protein